MAQSDTQTTETGPAPLSTWRPLAAVLTAGGLVAFSEIDRLIRNAVGIVTVDGEAAAGPPVSRTLGEVTSLNAWSRQDAWQVWAGVDVREDVAFLLGVALAAEVAFIVGYATLLWPLTRIHDGPDRPPWAWWRRTLLFLLLAIEGVEAVLLLAAAAVLAAGSTVPDILAQAVAVASLAKWATAILLAISLVRDAAKRVRSESTVRHRWRAAVVALWYHRVAVLVVVLLGAVTVLPYGGIFEQLPDVQRRWTTDPEGARHAALAFLATAALVVALWVLGRGRSSRAYATHAPPPVGGAERPEPRLWERLMWLIAFVVAGAVLVLLVARGSSENVERWPVATFLVTPLVLLGLSWGLWRVARGAGFRPVPPSRCPDLWLARVVWRTGDVLAVALLVVSGLGLVRSFLAPVLLTALGRDESPAPAADAVLLVVGIALAVLAYPGTAWVRHRTDPLRARAESVPGVRVLDPRRGAGTDGGWALYAPWILAGVGMVGVVVVMLTVSGVSDWLGVIAATVLLIGLWTVILGGIEVGLQQHQPLEVFRLMGLEAAPVIAIVAIPALAFGTLLDAPALHAMRPTGEPSPSSAQPPLDQAMAKWSDGACTVEVAGEDVRVMLLVAAQGGGIRAADWTARAMEVLNGDECTATAAFLSSGISGGSVGLALARSEDDRPGAEAIAGPEALAAAAASFTVGDLVAGGIGLRVPEASAGGAWTDRAGLIERTWEEQVPSLADAWSVPTDGPDRPTGYLVLNSADARGGCRVVISQVALTALQDQEATAAVGDCFGGGDRPPVTIDLVERCGGLSVSWATAAMASARFPTITPAGRVTDEVVGDCADAEGLRLVDGGYAEGSGLGTLSDVAPEVMAEVRRANSGSGPAIVPVLVYVQNAPRQDLAPEPPGTVPEPLIPVAGAQAGRSAQTSTDAYLQRISAQLAAACPDDGDAGCGEAVDAVRDALPAGVVVVGPATRPTIEAPLGWVMSGHSLRSSREAMAEQISDDCGRAPQGYGCFGELLEVLAADD